MTDFDASTARIWIAVDIALDATSGRAKHTDPVNQGGFIFYSVADHLSSLEVGEGGAILDIRYYGTDPRGPVVLSKGDSVG
jgi:hypothetical protein